jgi:Lysylphosphatidylglycerol synthase TM region
MTQQTTTDSAPTTPRRFTPAGIIFAVLGALLFVYYVWHAGPGDIWQNMRDLGAGFLLVLLISAVRPLVRSLAWTNCFEAPNRLRLRDALRAYLAGDALGNVMPLGIVVSEPTKAALVRDRVPLSASVAAIAVENLFYSLSVALFVATGMITVLLSFPHMPAKMRYVCVGALVCIGLIILVGYFIIRFEWRFVSRLLEFLYARRIFSGWLETRRVRIAAVEDRIYGFYTRNRARFLPIMLCEACFHLAGVVENYATLYFISPTRPTWLAAFALESVNRVINVVFKFVPMRVGVDEAVTGWFTSALQLGTTSGVSLAIVRKARVVVWTAIGVVLLVRQGLSPRAAVTEAQASIAAQRGGAKAPREQAG